MAASPDDRFAGLINSSAERGGWVPGDVFTADSEGEEEIVEPRRVRLPVLVALAVVLVGVLISAFFLFRPASQHAPVGGEESPAQTSGPPEVRGGAQHSQGAAGGAAATGGADTGAEAEGEVIVHVTGAVHTPKVVTLAAGARVHDAVEAAGGLLGSADAEAVNLARVLQDGEQIHVPAEGEEPASGTGGTGAGGSNAAGNSAAGNSEAGSSAAGQSAKVDLNTADAATLETLPGVGPVTAEAIIAHRQTQPFTAAEDLLLVKGIGPKTFESLRDRVTIG